MRKSICFLISIMITIMSCTKSDDSKDKDIIIGGIYSHYTEMVQSNFSTQFTISDSIYNYNKIEAALYSHQPTSKQNVFYILFSDTINPKAKPVQLEIFTSLMKPEDFFRKGNFNIDTIRIAHFKSNSGFSDDLTGVAAVFSWDTAYFENLRFKGKGSLGFIKKAEGPFLSGDFYPVQKISLEFK